jgi:predicted enzyme related to lactoylglutathione lyase
MANSTALRGLTTITFYASDHEAAKKWYTDFLGISPYLDFPGYSEFRLGDYQHEFGIIDSRFAPGGLTVKAAGAVTYWHVDDLKATFERLLSMGATEYEPITVRGDGSLGFVTASVVDPFGNILGIMYNPHYLEILNAKNAITNS